MIRDNQRFCDRCGQRIPASAKLAESGSADGADFCLQCRIHVAQNKAAQEKR